jgi:hypothetical protein
VAASTPILAAVALGLALITLYVTENGTSQP